MKPSVSMSSTDGDRFASQVLPEGWETQAREDFADFPVGPFPYDYSPLSQYHYVEPEGYRGRWREGTILSKWMGSASWNVVDADGEPAMEQSCVRESFLSVLVTGNEAWTDYRVSAHLRPLFSIPEPGRPVVADMGAVELGLVGIIARYVNGQNYYAFAFDSIGNVRLIRQSFDGQTVLASAPFAIDQDHTYTVTLEAIGTRLVGLIDGRLVVEAADASFAAGKIGLFANVPARFQEVVVSAPAPVRAAVGRRIADEQRLLLAEREKYPQPVLARTIPTPGFGASQHARFVDLDGDGRKEILLAQSLDRGPRDRYRMITCLTAIDLDGRVLWQFGRPTSFHGSPTSDIPFQVFDIDQDGHQEVILVKDFQIIALNGRTGEIKRSTSTPPARPPENMFYRTHGDCLAICNLRGRAQPQDLVVKDRYHNVWALDDQLNCLWHYSGAHPGHFPMVYDLDGDGKDEVIAGYNCLDEDGKALWQLPIPDHADSIAIGHFDPDHPEELEIRMAAGYEGLLWIDHRTGEITRQEKIGHVQRLSLANYRPELPGLEMAATTHWGPVGIVCFYDAKGDRYRTIEPSHVASPLYPANWTGDGQQLVFLNGSTQEGGLYDGWGRQVVVLPDDGHPATCCFAVDLLGDGRDELVVWDFDRICVYTQDRPFAGSRVHQPRRVLPYNVSNYRAEISLGE